MKRFTRVLSDARDQLEISEPSRTRVLLEMASDLEDSYDFHLSHGCDEAEARGGQRRPSGPRRRH